MFVGNRYGVEDEVELTTQVAVFQESGGQVVMEAEHFVGQDIGSSGRTWLTQTVLAGYVGPSYLSALPDTDLQFTAGYTQTSSELLYSISFTTTGAYTVWLRSYPPNAASDSAYVGVGDDLVEVTGFAPGQWSWANEQTNQLTSQLTITATGLYTLSLWMRDACVAYGLTGYS